MSFGQEDMAALAAAVERLERELPGWWWRVGACSVSADATSVRIEPGRMRRCSSICGSTRASTATCASLRAAPRR